ncbi:MAG: ribonuclease T2 [Dokdonella sp.]
MRPQRVFRSIIAIIVLALAATYSAYQGSQPTQRKSGEAPVTRIPSTFDYYLISLSWSPSYCETNPDDNEQCGRRGYGFILHGLWPQYDHGGGPQDCAGNEHPDRDTISKTLAFMPSRRLIEHEWRAHGSCSGLSANAYFDLADRAFAAVRIPGVLSSAGGPPPMTADDLRAAFVDANPGMQSDMLALSCHADTLSEIRICVDANLAVRTCGRGVRMQCPRGKALRIPLIR